MPHIPHEIDLPPTLPVDIINLNEELEDQLSTVITGHDPKTSTQNSRVTLLNRDQAEDLVERICAGEIGGGGQWCHGQFEARESFVKEYVN